MFGGTDINWFIMVDDNRIDTGVEGLAYNAWACGCGALNAAYLIKCNRCGENKC